MALVQAVNTAQIQTKIDTFANDFIALEALAEDLLAFNVNMTTGNTRVLGDDGQVMAADIMTELRARINALQSFVTYANTGSPSPLTYLRSVKRNV